MSDAGLMIDAVAEAMVAAGTTLEEGQRQPRRRRHFAHPDRDLGHEVEGGAAAGPEPQAA